MLNNDLALRSLAHDLKKPFHSMVTAINMFEYMKNDEKLFHQIKKELIKQSLMVTTIINDLIKPVNAEYQMAEESLFEVFDFCLCQIRRIYKEFDKEICLVSEFSHTNKPVINFYQFTRVIQNILHNAFEVLIDSEIKSKKIIITTKHIEINKNSFIEISISNNGPKINEVDLKNLFNPDFSKNKKYGVGIGLTSAKNIVERNKGTISVQNKNDGVEFKILIPASKISDN